MGRLPDQITVFDYTPHTNSGKNYDMKSGAVLINKSDIVSLSPTSPHGQQGFIINLKSNASVTYSPTGESPHTLSLSQLQVQLGDITKDGKTAVIGLKDVLVEVGWNYWLIANDGSEGIHNPQFVDSVLGNSIDALFPPVVPQVSE
jgi:hypothetical protein